MNQLRDNSGRAKAILTAFYVFLGVHILLLISSMMQYSLLGSDRLYEEGVADMNDLRHSIISIVYLVVFIVSIVLFIKWFRRAYYNLHQLDEQGLYLEFSEGWAAGAWFVPILNLFRPFQIMKEIWDDTQKYGRGMIQSSPILAIWWGTYIIGNVIENASARIFGEATIESIQNGTAASAIGTFIHIVSLICLIFIIRKISEFEKDLLNNQGETDIEAHLVG